MSKLWIVLLCLLISFNTNAQLSDSCKLRFGTNLAGISDWGTEQPFVDMMRYSRLWYTKDVDNPDAPWNSETIDQIVLRSDGYPMEMPQTVAGRPFEQKVATVWGVTDGWEAGNYIVLFDGAGSLSFGGNYTSLAHPSPNRYTFTMAVPAGGIFELVIESSDETNPVRNIRIIRDVYESTYATQPFNPTWIERLRLFKSVRFMDWGQTNNWAQSQPWEWEDTTMHNWNERAAKDYYTWTTSKGMPYEMMVQLMNDYDLDGWVCVPHTASDDYIREMARFFRDNLEVERKLTVEYSNETWNWMFGQAQWLNRYGCEEAGISWPEGTAPYMQNCLDIWAEEWAAQPDRLTRVIGVQTGWLDVAQRTAFNIPASSYDAIAATYYFGLNDSADAVLDGLGADATVTDVAALVRATWDEGKNYITGIKEMVADSAGKGLVFYEGGQHITPIPFGEEPSYSNAILEIQRDTSMYNLYNEWFDYLRNLQAGDEPLHLMNFSFISSRSARYGSWGILETQYQDTVIIHAPKYQAIIDNQHHACFETTSVQTPMALSAIACYPNPANSFTTISATENISKIEVYDMTGRLVAKRITNSKMVDVDLQNLSAGMYIVKVSFRNNYAPQMIKLIKR